MQVNGVSQVVIAPYSAGAFNNLPEFFESKGRLNDKHGVLDGFGKIVRTHQMQKFLGASLIHKHFQLREGERIVEEVKQDGTFTTPMDGISEQALTPYLWHLTREGLTFFWTPMEFVISTTIPPKVREFANTLPRKTAFLRELAEFLTAHEAQDTLGLSLLHRHHVQFDRRKEALLETQGPGDRMLEMKPVIPAMADIDEWTPTFWNFDAHEGPVVFLQLTCLRPQGACPSSGSFSTPSSATGLNALL